MNTHPERFRKSRSYCKQAVNAYRHFGATQEGFAAVVEVIQHQYNGVIMQWPRILRPSSMIGLTHEFNTAVHYSDWVVGGRNIFFLTDELVEEFLYTEISGIPIGAIQFPFASFYIGFNPRKELHLGAHDFPIDGAYIRAKESLPLEVSLRTNNSKWQHQNSWEWIFAEDPDYYLPLSLENPERDIEEVIISSVEKEIAELEHSKAESAKLAGNYNVLGKSITVVQPKKSSAEFRIEALTVGLQALKTSLRVLVNALFYISGYPEEIEETWPEGTPERLLNKLRDGNKRAKKIAKKGLIEGGFTKILLCGRSLQKPNRRIGKGDVASHWRRGHWRNQAVGKGRKDHKLIWIRPVLVRADKGEPPNGHIYDVKRENP